MGRNLLALAFASTAVLAMPLKASANQPAVWTPEALAVAVEHRASRSSFDDVERFGLQAIADHQPDRLQRIEHVAWLYERQSDFKRFSEWNVRLTAEALKARDPSYTAIAALDVLLSRYDQGDLSVARRVAVAGESAPAPLVRAHALMLQAYFSTLQGQTATALHLLSDADHLVMANGPKTARAPIWQVEGLALMRLQDLNGSAVAFGRSQFEFARPDYPDPSYVTLWNMAFLASRIGRTDLAVRLYKAEHRLSQLDRLESARSWDDVLCADVAESRDAPAEVLQCLQPLGADRRTNAFLAARILGPRAIAEARLNDLAAARVDLASLEALGRAGSATHTELDRLREICAEIMHAEGRDHAAFDLLRRYSRESKTAQASAFGQGVGQLTGLMAEQLIYRQAELATARTNLALADRVLRDQRVMGVAGGIICLAILAILAWQWRVSRQLRAARAEAEAGGRAKGEFLANMSHEIRTPLNGLLAMAEVMDRDALPAEQRKRLEVVRSSGKDLLHLLNDILDFSKIEAGKLELETVTFSVRAVFESTLATFGPAAQAKALSLTLDMAPEAEGLRQGDPAKLRQIVTNFISNALKFTSSGGVHVEVLGLGPDGVEGLQIAVRDTGIGLASEKIPVLFQKFSQGDTSTTRRFGGTGLGLAICQELATLMGGRVWAESLQDCGSTFYATLRLPLASEGDAPNAVTRKPETQPSETSGRRLRLLAAEDNATNRLVLSTIIQIFGFDLVVVEDGLQAVQAWRDGEFDAILMDVQMPVMDGVQATIAIRAQESQTGQPRTPIIALSANTFAHQIDAYMAAGMDAHVSKPIELQALQDALETIQVLSAPEMSGASTADHSGNPPDPPLQCPNTGANLTAA